MTKGRTQIILSVPGTLNRYGVFVENLEFDDFVKVQITSEVEKVKKGREHTKACEPYFYLARREDVKWLTTPL